MEEEEESEREERLLINKIRRAIMLARDIAMGGCLNFFFFIFQTTMHVLLVFFSTHLAFMIERIYSASGPFHVEWSVGRFTGHSRRLGLSISLVEQGNDGFIFISMVMPFPMANRGKNIFLTLRPIRVVDDERTLLSDRANYSVLSTTKKAGSLKIIVIRGTLGNCLGNQDIQMEHCCSSHHRDQRSINHVCS